MASLLGSLESWKEDEWEEETQIQIHGYYLLGFNSVAVGLLLGTLGRHCNLILIERSKLFGR